MNPFQDETPSLSSGVTDPLVVVPDLVASDGPTDGSVHRRFVIGMRVDAPTYEGAAKRILEWALSRDSRYVCVASVNNAIQARDDPSFKRAMNEADMVTPDGMALVWALRALGVQDAGRVYGPDLLSIVCAAAADRGVPIGFYGGTSASLESLIGSLEVRFPALRVAYRWNPPFRPLSADEDRRVCEEIARSGARILFVGLGAPKQERWMAEHRGRIPAVMVGVGAAFDFVGGRKPQAPYWMQRSGLEWLFRLAHEPRRLWRRYLIGNPRFIALFVAQLADQRVGRTGTSGNGTKGSVTKGSK